MIGKITKVIEESEKLGLHDNTAQDVLDGFSGKKLVGLMQRLTGLYPKNESTCYLEVGVFQGLTLLSIAAANPKISCYGIDNFAFFDPDGKNKGIIEKRKSKLNLSNAFLIEKDYEDALDSLSEDLGQKKIGVYFIDGPHDYRSQLMCLELALPYLSDYGVIIIDDSNYAHVRQANRDFLKTHPGFKLIFEAYTNCHPLNMSAKDKTKARDGWWNGVNVIVHDPQSELDAMYPPTERNRLLFENDHLIHAHALSEFAVNGLSLLDSSAKFRIFKTMKSLMSNIYKIRRSKNNYLKRFLRGNTYSEDLTHYNINRPKISGKG